MEESNEPITLKKFKYYTKIPPKSIINEMPLYFKYKKMIFNCTNLECNAKWFGSGAKRDCTGSEYGFELHCPWCNKCVDIVVYPKDASETSISSKALNEDGINYDPTYSKEVAIINAKKVKLLNINQLPDLQYDKIILHWRPINDNIYIFHGLEILVWSERLSNPEQRHVRLGEILEILREKYGNRLKKFNAHCPFGDSLEKAFGTYKYKPFNLYL